MPKGDPVAIKPISTPTVDITTAKSISNSLMAAQKTIEHNLISDIAQTLNKHTEMIEAKTKAGASNPV